jgi:hypothetical protein
VSPSDNCFLGHCSGQEHLACMLSAAEEHSAGMFLVVVVGMIVEFRRSAEVVVLERRACIRVSRSYCRHQCRLVVRVELVLLPFWI